VLLNTILIVEDLKKSFKKSMKLIKYFLMKERNNNMMFIGNEDSEHEDLEVVKEVLTSEDSVVLELHLISEDSEIFFEECFEAISEELEEKEKLLNEKH
jgi:hypothetical protein